VAKFLAVFFSGCGADIYFVIIRPIDRLASNISRAEGVMQGFVELLPGLLCIGWIL
jgi:hypothetical protein